MLKLVVDNTNLTTLLDDDDDLEGYPDYWSYCQAMRSVDDDDDDDDDDDTTPAFVVDYGVKP
jgi:hypothetical protein